MRIILGSLMFATAALAPLGSVAHDAAPVLRSAQPIVSPSLRRAESADRETQAQGARLVLTLLWLASAQC